ncbi:unnamed protein product [Caenorhabditis angaria]|uniref:Tc1-like transposase DDE domain-containing protein n=1 Tax=Caenorhabditis angaria TaxID=860376 RepID=A0A9P1I456_9PELO|nr:unnamed protein product [Caenorhabditis angaria]
MLKPQIVSIFEDFVRKNGGRQNMKKYVIDEEARSQGVEILRLPPYHCIYNPIELVWAALKFYLKTNCENMKLSEARKCALEWLKNYTAAEAAACIRHVEDLEEETRKKLTEKDNEEMEKERERAEAEDSYNDRNLMEAESDYEGYEYDLDSDDEEDYELEHVVDDSDNSVGYDDDDIEELLRAYNDCESDDST